MQPRGGVAVDRVAPLGPVDAHQPDRTLRRVAHRSDGSVGPCEWWPARRADGCCAPRRGRPPARRPTGCGRRCSTPSGASTRSRARRWPTSTPGSGALGIEALSRGAATVTFVESVADRAVGHRGQPAHAPGWPTGPPWCPATRSRHLEATTARFDLVLADPPYAYDGWPALAAAALARLTPDGPARGRIGPGAGPRRRRGRPQVEAVRRYGGGVRPSTRGPLGPRREPPLMRTLARTR